MMRKILFAAAAFAAAPFAFAPAIAQADTFTGPRLEARLGYETPTVSDGSVYKLGNSATIGAELGYDLAIGRTIAVGPFVNYEYGNSKDCSSDGTACLESDGNIQAGGRVGFQLGAKAQLYGKLGYDRFRLKATEYGQSGSQNLTGVMGAIGVDVAVSKHLYAGFEIDYADLGKHYDVNFQRRHAALVIGTHF